MYKRQDPHTLEEAVKLASRIEISKASVEPAAPGRQRINRRVEDQPADSQPTEVEITTTPRRVSADMRRQPEDGLKHKRRGEVSPASFSSPRKRGRRVRAAVPTDNGQVEEMARRLQQVELARQREQAEVATLRRKLEQYEWPSQPRPPDRPACLLYTSDAADE